MSDTYYIIVTAIFGVFVIIMMVWLWRYMRTSNPLELKHEDLSDDQKRLIYKFCSESRRAREQQELQKEAKEIKESKEIKETNPSKTKRK